MKLAIVLIAVIGMAGCGKKPRPTLIQVFGVDGDVVVMSCFMPNVNPASVTLIPPGASRVVVTKDSLLCSESGGFMWVGAAR